jgi:hypothetical protein
MMKQSKKALAALSTLKVSQSALVKAMAKTASLPMAVKNYEGKVSKMVA